MATCCSSEEDSYLLSVLSKQVKEIAIKECNKKNSKSRYALFYGSDAEDTDEEDWPQPRDAETRERMLLARGPLTYRSNRKPVEEARQLNAFNSTHR
ncbi:hypothetical protein Tco_0056782, partial [Tanacetum coccineum]